MSRFLTMIHVVVTEGHLHYHKLILVKRVPDNVQAISISFLLNRYRLNHGLIIFLLNHMD